jgi:hypothetical protein
MLSLGKSISYQLEANMPINPETDYDYCSNRPAKKPEEIVYKPDSAHEWERGPQHVEPMNEDITRHLDKAIEYAMKQQPEMAQAWALIVIAEKLGAHHG